MAAAKSPRKLFNALAPIPVAQIDEPAGIIRGVAVITEGQPTDARVDESTGLPIYIDETTLQQVADVASEYEGGLKVKADHGSGVFAVAGFLTNFRIEKGADGMGRTRADFRVFPSEPNKAKLFDMARTIPDTFGFSISCGGQDENRGDRMLLRCEEIYSADLVSEPAANPTGLFSETVDAKNKAESSNPITDMDPNEILKQCGALVDAAKADMAQRFAAHDKSLEELKKMMASVGDGVTGTQSTGGESGGASGAGTFARLQTEVKNLSASLEEVKKLGGTVEALKKDLESMPKNLAKEFAAAVGTQPTRTGGGDGGGEDEPKEALAKFELSVKKNFKLTNSKTAAMRAAIVEQPDGYKAFLSSDKSALKYA